MLSSDLSEIPLSGVDDIAASAGPTCLKVDLGSVRHLGEGDRPHRRRYAHRSHQRPLLPNAGVLPGRRHRPTNFDRWTSRVRLSRTLKPRRLEAIDPGTVGWAGDTDRHSRPLRHFGMALALRERPRGTDGLRLHCGSDRPMLGEPAGPGAGDGIAACLSHLHDGTPSRPRLS